MFTKLNSLSFSTPLFSPESKYTTSLEIYDEESKTAQKKLDRIENTISQQPSFFQSNKNTLLLVGFMALATGLLAVGLFTPYGPQDFTAFDSLAGQKGGAIAFENAKLASGFVTAGFALPIVIGTIGCLSLLSSYFSHKSKINKFTQLKNTHQQDLDRIKRLRDEEIEIMATQNRQIRELNTNQQIDEMQRRINRYDRQQTSEVLNYNPDGGDLAQRLAQATTRPTQAPRGRETVGFGRDGS